MMRLSSSVGVVSGWAELGMVCLQLASIAESLHASCGTSPPGGECYFDEDCYGDNTRCLNGGCVCQIGFESYTHTRKLSNGIDQKRIFCRPAPDQLGASCQSDCKAPLICRDGFCECWQADYINGTCVIDCGKDHQLSGQDCLRVAKLNEPCRIETECVEPFSTCAAGICKCSEGTAEIDGACVSACPDGSSPVGVCHRLFLNDIDMLDHSSQTDSCPMGFQCMTYGKPLIGHCCPTTCPFGKPDITKSCAPGAPLESKCRDLTHYCHKTESPGWYSSACCPRPCRDPRPLYINGNCFEVGLGSECRVDLQCPEGSRCYIGRCDCECGRAPDDFLKQRCVEQDTADPLNLKTLADDFLTRTLFRPNTSPLSSNVGSEHISNAGTSNPRSFNVRWT